MVWDCLWEGAKIVLEMILSLCEVVSMDLESLDSLSTDS